MTTARKTMWAVVAAAAIGAAGCDGSSGGGQGAGGAATVTGKVQPSSGGLVVNGVSFRTSGASLREDGGSRWCSRARTTSARAWTTARW